MVTYLKACLIYKFNAQAGPKGIYTEETKKKYLQKANVFCIRIVKFSTRFALVKAAIEVSII